MATARAAIGHAGSRFSAFIDAGGPAAARSGVMSPDALLRYS